MRVRSHLAAQESMRPLTNATVIRERDNGSGMLEEGKKNLTPEIESLDECTRPDGCRWEAVCTLDSLCWAAERHARAHHKPDPEPWPRQDDLNEKESKTVRVKWTRESAITAVEAFAAEHGQPPATKDALGSGGLIPTEPTARKLFGSWGDMIEAAGFERPIKGRTRRRPGPAQPSPEETDHAASPPGGAEEPEPEVVDPPGRDLAKQPTAPPPTARAAVADPDKVDVFELLGQIVTDERIDFHERQAEQHQLKAEALRQIKGQLEALAE